MLIVACAEYEIALHPREWSVDGLMRAVAKVALIPIRDQRMFTMEVESREVWARHSLDHWLVDEKYEQKVEVKIIKTPDAERREEERKQQRRAEKPEPDEIKKYPEGETFDAAITDATSWCCTGVQESVARPALAQQGEPPVGSDKGDPAAWELFQSCDIDSNGMLSSHELAHLLGKRAKRLCDEQMAAQGDAQALIERFDTDNDGFIGEEEFKKLWDHLNSAPLHFAPAVGLGPELELQPKPGPELEPEPEPTPQPQPKPKQQPEPQREPEPEHIPVGVPPEHIPAGVPPVKAQPVPEQQRLLDPAQERLRRQREQARRITGGLDSSSDSD